MREELLERARQAVELATAAGASDAWAGTSRGREVEFSLRDGKLENVKDATSRSLSLSLYVDGKYSNHSTTDLRPEQLQAFITEAVALTRALQPDPHREIPNPELFAGRAEIDLELVDEGVSALTRDERIELCKAQNALLAGKSKVISATSGVSDGHTLRASVSSNGFEGTHEETYLWLGSEVTLQGEGDKKPNGWMWGGANHKGDAPNPEEIAAETLKRANDRLGTAKGKTQRTTMVVHPSSTASLIGRLLASLNASSVQQGRSFWAGKKDQKLVSDALTIVDDPLIVRGLGSRLFDGEGIAAKRLPLIDKGVLQNFYVDTYYGKKLGWAPTTAGPSNRVVAGGSKNLDGLLADAGSAVLVTSWLGGNADSTTGDFSFGIRGHLVENGQIGAPIGEMNVTGNLADLFGTLVAVGNDPWKYSSTRCGTLVFDGVQFSGV